MTTINSTIISVALLFVTCLARREDYFRDISNSTCRKTAADSKSAAVF